MIGLGQFEPFDHFNQISTTSTVTIFKLFKTTFDSRGFFLLTNVQSQLDRPTVFNLNCLNQIMTCRHVHIVIDKVFVHES